MDWRRGPNLVAALEAGQTDAVRRLDAEDEVGRHRLGVPAHDVGLGQNRRVAREQ